MEHKCHYVTVRVLNRLLSEQNIAKEVLDKLLAVQIEKVKLQDCQKIFF